MMQDCKHMPIPKTNTIKVLGKTSSLGLGLLDQTVACEKKKKRRLYLGLECLKLNTSKIRKFLIHFNISYLKMQSTFHLEIETW